MYEKFCLTSLFLLLFLSACDFKDSNIDPTRETDASLKEILPSAIGQTARNLLSIGHRVTAIVVQHLEGVDAQPQSYSQYLIDERTLDTFWKNGLYAGAMKDCQLIIEKAEIESALHYSGIAHILLAMNFGLATSYWGDIPLQEALAGIDQLQPAYDKQESVYSSIQKLLDKGIVLLQKKDPASTPAEDDLIFGGDVGKWISVAWALKARYYLHVVKQQENAANLALQAIHSGAFSSIEKQADFHFGNSINEGNPFALFGIERPDQLVLGNHLLQLLQYTNDPRLSKYASETNTGFVVYQEDNLELYWAQLRSAIPLISFVELKFIESEALLHLRDIEQSEIVLQEAVRANFYQLGIDSSAATSFIKQQVHFENHPSTVDKLSLIIHQKYIALFSQGTNEVWVDYRRTGFPSLKVPANVNPSFNPSLIIPKRYLYPVSERNSNYDNLHMAKKRQEGHLMDVGMWVFE